MGTINQGILGGFSGKVATVIGVIWNGIACMRGKALSYHNPNTPAQLEQRAKFALAIKFLRPLVALLRISFKTAGSKMTGFNSAMAYILGNAIQGAYPAFEIDYSKVRVCQGNLPAALNPAAVSVVPGHIDFTWDNNSAVFGANAADEVVLVVYNPTNQSSVVEIGIGTRAQGNQTVEIPELFSGETVQCYIGFTNGNKSAFSNSQFVDEVIVM